MLLSWESRECVEAPVIRPCHHFRAQVIGDEVATQCPSRVETKFPMVSRSDVQ